MDALTQLFASKGFMPHGYCFQWTSSLLWTYVFSDGVIALAYYSIPIVLWTFVRRRDDLPFSWVFVMFAVFIMACGTTHAVGIWNIWRPVYWLDAGIKAVTATVSLATAALLWPLLPRALALPSPAKLRAVNRELETEIATRRSLEGELKALNEQLERRVAERTRELAAANAELRRRGEERERSEERLRSQLERLNLLDQITCAIGERQDLRSIYQVVVQSLEDRLPADFCCICGHDAERGTLSVQYVGKGGTARAPGLDLREGTVIEIDGNGLARCVGGQLVHEPDLRGLAFPLPRRLAAAGLLAMVLVPLQSGNAVSGVLVAARRQPASFASGDCEFLRQLSAHVALALQQAQLYGALQKAYDDLRQSEQAVLQQERLRALGEMASGIAHDINNAISPVTLYAESLLQREAGLSARARAQIESIARAIDDVAATVARMREFYRPREPQLAFTTVSLNRLVRQVVEHTQARWRDMPQQRGVVIQTSTELAENLPPVMGVESELREALINLVFNAVDAMPEGGRLCVRTRAIDAAAAPAGAARVRVEVADTGVGMDEHTLDHCLEPFFTTKGERGTGLGLAMVYGVTQRHGAELDIDSEPGQGTTVSLSFALADPAAAAGNAPAAPLHVPRLRILLVDDDPLVLGALREALEGDGHEVRLADGGQAGVDALRAARTGGQPFDAVITDLGMPYVDGRTVARAAKQGGAVPPVLLLTGWGQRLLDDGELPADVDAVLSKPPKLAAVREALARLCGPRTDAG